MEVEYGHVLLLERRAHSLDDVACLRKCIIFVDSTAVRIVFEFYARDKYAPSSRPGQNALMAHLWSVADNKIVEDIHQPLRLNARANVNKSLSSRIIQDIILRSEVFDKRGIPHACQVDKRGWLQTYAETKVNPTAQRGDAAARNCCLGVAARLHRGAWRKPSPRNSNR